MFPLSVLRNWQLESGVEGTGESPSGNYRLVFCTWTLIVCWDHRRLEGIQEHKDSNFTWCPREALRQGAQVGRCPLQLCLWEYEIEEAHTSIRRIQQTTAREHDGITSLKMNEVRLACISIGGSLKQNFELKKCSFRTLYIHLNIAKNFLYG